MAALQVQCAVVGSTHRWQIAGTAGGMNQIDYPGARVEARDAADHVTTVTTPWMTAAPPRASSGLLPSARDAGSSHDVQHQFKSVRTGPQPPRQFDAPDDLAVGRRLAVARWLAQQHQWTEATAMALDVVPEQKGALLLAAHP